MRCSSCSRPVRPVVALDIDGTLGDYHGHFKWFAERYLGRPMPAEDYDYTAPFGEWLGLDKRTYREIKLAYRQGGMKRWMPAYAGVDDLSHRARAAGCEVWIATTRPYMRLDNIDPDTRHWLERNGMRYDAITYGEDKYHDMIEKVESERIIAVIDDLPEQIERALELGIASYLASNGHAEKVRKWYRTVEGTEQMARIIEEGAYQWNQLQQ